MKRIIASLLAALMLLGSLAACASDDQGTADTTAAVVDTAVTAPVETEPEITDNLPEESLNGYNFRMFIRPAYGGDLWVEAETGDQLNDAVFARNRAVEERFDITVTSTMSIDNNGTDCLPTILAGDDAWDLLAPHGRQAFNIVLQGAALDWNLLPHVDLTREWWDQGARENFTIHDKLYAMIGDMSYLNLGYSFCMMFNKDLFTANNLEFPYQAVLDGTWTWDMWEEILSTADVDVNGDGAMTWENDQFGYLTHEWYGLIAMQYTTGMRAVTVTNGEPEITFMSEQTVESFQRYFSHITKGANVTTAANMFTAFKEGRVFTIDGTVHGTSNLRDMEGEFGIVPWPKYDEKLPYASSINAAASLFNVPVTISDPKTTSIILEGMSSESYINLIPVYYEVILKAKQARDSESAQVLDVIRGSRVFDFAYFNDSIGLSSVPVNLYSSFGNADNIASYYKKLEPSAIKSLDKLIDKYDQMAADQAGT